MHLSHRRDRRQLYGESSGKLTKRHGFSRVAGQHFHAWGHVLSGMNPARTRFRGLQWRLVRRLKKKSLPAEEASVMLRVLVAEDDAVNQAVILRVLDELGHFSVLARNGREALALAFSQKFDLAFMDVQMPEMDGLATTEAIRQREKTSGTHLPIFAMTEHATTEQVMKDEREHCLQAGMEGCITKPVRSSDIEKTLAGFARAPTVLGPSPSAKVSWGKTEALDRLGGDEDLLRELCQIFLEESPKLMQKLQKAIADADPEAVMRAAHSLKGELGYLGAAGPTQAARALEDMGHEKNLSQAREVLAVLERELGALHLALRDPAGAIQ